MLTEKHQIPARRFILKRATLDSKAEPQPETWFNLLFVQLAEGVPSALVKFVLLMYSNAIRRQRSYDDQDDDEEEEEKKK